MKTSNHPLHLLEVVDGLDSLPDQVIPNSVPGAPLSGIEPLARVMELTSITATTTIAGGIVRFNVSDHSSVVDPTASLAVTVEMQSQIAGFLATSGTVIIINDANIIAQ